MLQLKLRTNFAEAILLKWTENKNKKRNLSDGIMWILYEGQNKKDNGQPITNLKFP